MPPAYGRVGSSVQREMLFTLIAFLTNRDSLVELSPFKEREGRTLDFK